MALTNSLARGRVLQLGGSSRPLLALVVTGVLVVMLRIGELGQLPLEEPTIVEHLVGVIVPYVGHGLRVEARAGSRI